MSNMEARDAVSKFRRLGRSVRKAMNRRRVPLKKPDNKDERAGAVAYLEMLTAFADAHELSPVPFPYLSPAFGSTLDADVPESEISPTPKSASAVSLNQSQSPLLRLPVELRELIFGYCLTDRFVFQPTPSRPWRYDHPLAGCTSVVRSTFYPWRANYSPLWPEQLHIRPPRDYRRELWAMEDTKPLRYLTWKTLDCASHSLVNISDRWPLDSTLPSLLPERPKRSFLSWQPWNGRSFPPPTASEVLDRVREDALLASDWSGVSLLLVCRQIYREAAPLILQGNTFSFAAPMHLHLFRQHIGRARFACIRYLHLGLLPGPPYEECSFDGQIDRRTWNRLCRMLARDLPALRELDVELHIAGPDRASRWQQPPPGGWEIFTHARTQYRQLDLLQWLEELRIFRGRLRRARVSCDSLIIPGFDPLLARHLEQKAREIQRYITCDGDQWWKELLAKEC